MLDDDKAMMDGGDSFAKHGFTTQEFEDGELVNADDFEDDFADDFDDADDYSDEN